MKIEAKLQEYLTKAMEKLVADVLKATLKNPRETKFLLKCGENIKVMQERRQSYAQKGKHIPGFLILSITNSCNLFCSGCYARANGLCNDDEEADILTDAQWSDIFRQGAELGIGIMLLAGGEPLLRPGVIKAASNLDEVVFPIFTNGTLIDQSYLSLFDKNRNLVPIISLEGGAQRTDERRGPGVTQKLLTTAAQLRGKKILFGVSLTVTRENFAEVTSADFMAKLRQQGCRAVLFIEYVAISQGTASQELTVEERQGLRGRQEELRRQFPAMVFISFPGDEEQMGGCLAAGRGFCHINPQGQVEACPFSPYGDRNLKQVSLLAALESPFFARLRQEHLVGGEHSGGCALFQAEAAVKKCLKETEELK